MPGVAAGNVRMNEPDHVSEGLACQFEVRRGIEVEVNPVLRQYQDLEESFPEGSGVGEQCCFERVRVA